jgi:flagellar motor switch/type III secretory pathway protein FliN
MSNTISAPLTKLTAPSAGTPSAAQARAPEELLPWLPCTLALEVPAVTFTVNSLLKLRPGSLVRTSFHQSADIPLQVNGMAMAWTEFELVGDSLAARITDLI